MPKRLSIMGRHYGVQARVQEETKKWFLTFSQKLKVIFGGFAIANLLDSRVAEALACR